MTNQTHLQVQKATVPRPLDADIEIEEVMTPQPVTIGRTETLATAHELMRENEVRHLPVLEHGELVGVVTQRNLYLLETIAGVDLREDSVDDAMSNDAYAVQPDAPLDVVTAHMAAHRYGCAVVIERGRVIGIFTATDALRVLAGTLPAASDAGHRRRHRRGVRDQRRIRTILVNASPAARESSSSLRVASIVSPSSSAIEHNRRLAAHADGHDGDVACRAAHDVKHRRVGLVEADRPEIEPVAHGLVEDAAAVERDEDRLHLRAIAELRRAGPPEVAASLGDEQRHLEGDHPRAGRTRARGPRRGSRPRAAPRGSLRCRRTGSAAHTRRTCPPAGSGGGPGMNDAAGTGGAVATVAAAMRRADPLVDLDDLPEVARIDRVAFAERRLLGSTSGGGRCVPPLTAVNVRRVSGIGISEPSPLRGGSDPSVLVALWTGVPHGGVSRERRCPPPPGTTCACRSETGMRLGRSASYVLASSAA